jgi:dolichol kinase
MDQINQGTINYKDELVRKLIHLCSLSIPIVYYFVSQKTAIIVLAILTFFAFMIDIARYYFHPAGKIFYSIFGFLLREHEVDYKKKNLNGATYVLLSALICVIIFPKVIFITAFSVLIIADSVAALVGRKFGRHKFISKSLEGTLGFFISGTIVVFFTPKVDNLVLEYIIGIIAVAIGAVAENASFGFADDNLVIPIFISLTMWLLYIFLLPNLQLVLQNVPR